MRRFAQIGAALVALAVWLSGCEGEVQTPDAPDATVAVAADARPDPNASAGWADEVASPDGGWRLRYRPTPDPIPRNRLFELDLELVGADPDIAVTAVEARMPEHRHGMTLRPELQPLGDGRYRVEGLLFHMSGLWELLFSVRRNTHTERARFEIVVE